ncbi:hypothetical protein MIMGU_mgv1a012773mg [Erythranthe guttata]|uniref:Dienelactone hydrolase domain-containing protein n=1 Tax=Erythranthe guttata TaxID=4155 RepID=A0A022RCR0_ERYGU|nr:hypothetical protein MIMGU_mgv1a012773mg [Erythranthe guttata]
MEMEPHKKRYCFAGYEAPELRKIADKIAAAGYYVVVPDFFNGDPLDPDNVEKLLPVWLSLHEPAKAYEEAKLVIDALKSKGITAIGAAGFCYGAKVVVELAKSSDLIQAGVLLHPSFVTLDDVKEVKAPLAILGAEMDQYTPPELVKQFEEILSSNSEVESFVKIFPGVAHGWTVRYDLDDEMAVKSAEEAQQDTLDWIMKFVK